MIRKRYHLGKLLPIFGFVLFCWTESPVFQVLADDSAEFRELLGRAKGGDAHAQFQVGAAYDTGRGTRRDGPEAMKWYRLSAEQGLAEGQNSVGSGLQAEEKYSEAIVWYEKAAAQGHALAMSNLAYLHDLGLGTRQDRNKAFELYSRSADLGWAEAMWNLANMYGAGQVGKKNLRLACVWSVRAKKYARSSEAKLVAQLDGVLPKLERTLPREQWASCKAEGAAWSPTSAVPSSTGK